MIRRAVMGRCPVHAPPCLVRVELTDDPSEAISAPDIARWAASYNPEGFAVASVVHENPPPEVPAKRKWWRRK